MMKPLSAILGISVLAAVYSTATPTPQQDEAAVWEADTATVVDSFAPYPHSPVEVFLLAEEFSKIEYSVRLDMIDYYLAGKKEKMPTRFGGTAFIDSISDRYMKVVTSESSFYEIGMYEMKGQPLFALIQTVMLPAEDSRLTFYDADSLKDDLLEMPSTADFLTKEGKKQQDEVARRVSFPMTRLDICQDGTIEARSTVCRFLGKEDSAFVAPLLKEKIVYRWNGKKFRKEK